MTITELLDRAVELAGGIGQDAGDSPIVDNDVTAEMIYPHAVKAEIMERVASGEDLSDVVQTHSVTMSGGYGTLPVNAIAECADVASLPDFPYASHMKYKADYDRFKFNASGQLVYFGIFRGRLYCTDATTPLTLEIPSIPVIPSDTTAALTISPAVADGTITKIAAVLRGEIPLSRLTGYSKEIVANG